jgi:hypothetical protein
VGIGPSPIDVDGVNDATLPLCLAIPPRVAANLALAAAEAICHALECATPEMIAQIEALGGKFRLRRWEHRREHLEQIERVLEKKNRESDWRWTSESRMKFELRWWTGRSRL